MSRTTNTFSAYTRDSCLLLGELIRCARKERHMTVKEVADRAGISRGTLQRIERGDENCQIGSVFEVATIVGLKLFDADDKNTLAKHINQTADKLTLLPKSIRKKSRNIDDDF